MTDIDDLAAHLRVSLALMLYRLSGLLLVWALRLMRASGEYHIVTSTGYDYRITWQEERQP